MKIKKGLALILALAMIITLMPTMAFAATTNSVAKTYTVAADEDMPVVAIDLKVNDATGMSGANKFKLSLENAEWAVENPTTADLVEGAGALRVAYVAGKSVDTAGLAMSMIADSETDIATDQIEVNAVESNSATITYTPSATVQKDTYIRLYLALRAGSENGSVKVTIDGMDSAVTGGTYTVATASGSTTVAEVTGKVKVYPRQEVTGATVEITETSVNAITDNQILKLTLPKGYSWSGLKVSGDLAEGFAQLGTPVDSIDALKTAENGQYFKVDDRTLYVRVDIASVANIRESIVLTPTFNITKDAEMGDITLTVSSYWAESGNKIATESNLVVATYGDESVKVSTVDEEDLPEIVAGYLDDKDGNNFVVEVTLKEETKGSLSAGRYIDFDFNDEVQVAVGEDIKYYVGTGSRDYDEANVMPAGLLDFANNKEKDCSEFTITVPADKELTGWDATKANTLTLYIPVTAEADFTGDVELSISGAKAGVEDTSLVVGKVIAPITVETQVSDIVNGAQQQAAANIVIKENIPGYLDAGESIVLDLDTLGLEGFAFGDASAAVTDGDIDINKIVVDKSGTITIPVKDTSTIESTITVSDVIVNLGRNLPVGSYDLSVGGNALVENGDYMDEDFADETVNTPYLNITTASDGINATFTDGQSSYTVNGQTVEMDAAPYIDSNNRMLVPIRYAANAMGVSDDNIQWNGYTQTGTISGAMGVVRVTVGSTNLSTSNGTITMDTVAVNTNDRIYVPVRYIANALGANVSWDASTRTATFY